MPTLPLSSLASSARTSSTAALSSIAALSVGVARSLLALSPRAPSPASLMSIGPQPASAALRRA
jgi:hypothetical protein